MFKNTEKNISNREIEYSYLSLISNKIRVGIIGGGNAGAIKAKSFLKKASYVEVLSEDFNEYFLRNSNSRLKLNTNKYNKDFLKDKHIIVIALDDEEWTRRIEEDCKKEYKIYINATDFSSGMAVIPVQRESNNLNLAISTKVGNPKGSILVANEALKVLRQYDDFIAFSGHIRSKAKELKGYKKQIIDFVCSEDFRYIYSKNKDKEILQMFFTESIVRLLYSENEKT